MAFVVVSECVQAETGRRFQPGQILPASIPDATALRFERVGCAIEVDLDAFDRASPEAVAALKAVGIHNAADAARLQADADAGQAAHSSGATDGEAQRAGLNAALDAEEVSRREAILTRLGDEEAALRQAMTGRLSQEEEGAREQLKQRLGQEEADGRSALTSRLATEEDEGRAALQQRLAAEATSAPADDTPAAKVGKAKAAAPPVVE